MARSFPLYKGKPDRNESCLAFPDESYPGGLFDDGEFHPAVHGHVFLGGVGADRPCFSESAGHEAVRGDSLIDQEVLDRAGPAFGFSKSFTVKSNASRRNRYASA